MPDNAIALTCGLFEARPVEYDNFASVIFDQTSRLQCARNKGDGCPSHAEHLRKKLLRQANDVRLGLETVLRLQQPPS